MADNTTTNVNLGNSAFIASLIHYYNKGYKYSQALRTQPGYTDCSALVYTGLKEGGFNVPNNTFATSQLFNGSGSTLTSYAQNNFDYINKDNARNVGTLQSGDILMWRAAKPNADGTYSQHVAFFSHYDASGKIVFFGAQTSTGPAFSSVSGFWDGISSDKNPNPRIFQGVLRPKPSTYNPSNDITLLKPLSDASDLNGTVNTLADWQNYGMNSLPVLADISEVGQIGATGALTEQRALTWTNAINERYGDDVALVSTADGTKFLVKASTGEQLAIIDYQNNSVGLIDIYNGDSFTLNSNSTTVVTNNMLDDYGMTKVTQTLNSAGYITGVTVSGTDANGMDYFEVYGENGTLLSRTTTEVTNGEYLKEITTNYSSDGQPLESTSKIYDFDGNVVEMPTESSGLQNLIDGFSNFRDDINNSDTAQAINTYGPAIIDALSLIKAIQSGEPLPVVASGLRLANDISMINKTPNYTLSGAASAASGVLSLMSLDAALKSGDGWAIATSSAYTISFAATAYAQFVTQTSAITSVELASAFGEAGGAAVGALGEALPYLGLAAAIATGDEVGIAVAAVSIAFPAVGVAYAIYSMIGGLFGGDEIPDPWGTGRYVWDGTSIRIQSSGETGGNEAVSGVMQNVLNAINSLIEQQRLTNPTSALGIIPNRMPSVAYDMSGYRYTDIDPLTGVELHPSLRFDTSGNPYNATAGSPESYQSIGEAIIRSALSRSAIAPMWEVQTAKMQTDAGDPKAGLTEEARAGRDGQLAAEVTGDTQTFRPVTLDLSGNGQIDTVSKADSGVSFDVDDSGYMKETAWVGGGDAFLTLDRDYNGETNSGREMFSNSTVTLGRRGLARMSYVNNLNISNEKVVA